MAVLKVPSGASAYVNNCVSEVAESVYGRDNRKPIHDAIDYLLSSVKLMSEWCEGIGLCVKDGKLCVIYER